MAQRGAFGIAGGAAGILDVDRIGELLLALPLGQGFRADTRRHGHDLAPSQHAR